MAKKWMTILGILLAFTLVAAACGDDDDAGSGDDSAEPASDDGAASDDDGAASDDDGAASDDGHAATVPDNPDEGFTSDTIKVGWMGDLTGPTASSQSFHAHGAESYYACVNEDGGRLGRQYEFLAEDDQFSAETAAVNFTKLTEDSKVLALADMGGSHIATQLAPDVERLNLAVVGSGQTIDIQLEGDQFFNTIAHYGDQADIAAGQIAADVGGIENAVVMGISLEVPSGTEYAAYVEQSVTNAGGTYVDTLYVAPGATEVTAQMVALAAAIEEQGVNYVTLHGSPGSSLVVLQGMSDTGITEVPVVGIHGVSANSLWEEGPADVTDQTFGVNSYLTANNDTEGAAELVRCAALAGYAGEELILTFVQGFVSAMVIDQAVERAAETGEVSRESVTEALKGTFETMGLTCTIDWTTSQHSPCGAPFSYDAATGGMVPSNPFDFYAPSFDGEYGIEIG